MSTLDWLNVALFLLVFVACVGALNKMQNGTTRPCIIGAVLLIAVGSVGQAFGQILGQWAAIFDTALAGGVLALLIASQRTHTWILERWANPLASTVVALTGALFLLSLLSGCATTKQSQPAYDGPPMIMKSVSGDTVRLTKEPCSVASGWLAFLNKADMVYQGKSYEACWFAMGPYVIVLDSNTDASPIPAQVFQRDDGV